ncbi:MAG TPA: O-antigen ligase family protein [Solirubrobacteraceae bacterium]|nr:O-antigen ligase family protein [Solirubrobacteraceae bacterium]
MGRSQRLLALPRKDAIVVGGAAATLALLVAAGVRDFGPVALLLPVAFVGVAMLVVRPVLTLVVVVGLTIFCEGPEFGLLNFTSHLYTQVYKDISLLDLLVGLLVVSALLDVLRNGRALRVPRALAVGIVTLALAMVAGAYVGHTAGISLRYSIFSEHILFYLLLVPVAVANLELDEDQIKRLLGGAMALAVVKAILGLLEVSLHLGKPIEGSSTLTYYEPTANWLMMIALLAIIAALLMKVTRPRWILLSSPLLIACLLFSYRRSFWIAVVLGALLVVLLGTSPAGRRLLIPASLAVAGAIWLLGSLNFQSNLPVVRRVNSLSFGTLEANREDRYRLDERANVWAEIRAHPITGLGVGIPWQATAAPLSLEHEEGRQYVHFAALWYWLKLGALGLCAYVALMIGSVVLAWQAWRRAAHPWLRAFGLASVCGIAGLIVMDTTASFTGVEGRFTVVLAVQLGLLALLARGPDSRGDERPLSAESSA